MSTFLSRLREAIRPKQDDRLALLAVELGMAGAEVLQEDFGFTQQMATVWLDKMLNKAKVNRALSIAMQAIQAIDGDDKTTGR